MVIDSSFFYLGPWCFYSLHLLRIFGFVVFWQLDDLPISTQGRSRVSCVGNDDPVARNKDYVSCASDRVSHFTIRKGLHAVLYCYLSQLFLSFLCVHHFIQLHKYLSQGFVVVTRLIVFILFHLYCEVIGTKVSDFGSSVTVENPEKEYLFIESVVQDRILHMLSPT